MKGKEFMIKKIKWWWMNFWGRRYWVYKDDLEINEILIYGHKIFIKK